MARQKKSPLAQKNHEARLIHQAKEKARLNDEREKMVKNRLGRPATGLKAAGIPEEMFSVEEAKTLAQELLGLGYEE